MGAGQDLPLEEYHAAGDRILKGDAHGYRALYSRRDDVTLANPFGPPVRGWEEVSARLEVAAGNYRDGELTDFQNVTTYVGGELAYTVEIESGRARVGGADDFVPISVRVTTVFRLEDGEWKLVHRHGDPITTRRPAESVIQE